MVREMFVKLQSMCIFRGLFMIIAFESPTDILFDSSIEVEIVLKEDS